MQTETKFDRIDHKMLDLLDHEIPRITKISFLKLGCLYVICSLLLYDLIGIRMVYFTSIVLILMIPSSYQMWKKFIEREVDVSELSKIEAYGYLIELLNQQKIRYLRVQRIIVYGMSCSWVIGLIMWELVSDTRKWV